MPIYTGTGDKGRTGLFNNERVTKDDIRIEAYGVVDELNSVLGQLRAENLPKVMDDRLQIIQSALFDLGADLATPGKATSAPAVHSGTSRAEEWIDESEASLPPLKTFVLPGGHKQAALLHVARTTARRAERRFWTLKARDEVPDTGGIYLNRLSDLFFSWARLANHENGVPDVPWTSSESK